MWEEGEIASPSEQRPLGMEDGTTTRLWLPRAPAEPLDVEGDAAAFSRCLSSASLMRFRSSPAPPAAPCLYICRADNDEAPLNAAAAAASSHAGSAI